MVINLRVPAPDMWSGAKCRLFEVTRDYDPFFGFDGIVEEDEVNEEMMGEAVAFCNGDDDGVVCPIRHGCLIFALTNNLKHGVFGGTTPRTRKLIRGQWPLKRGKVPRPEWGWMSEEDAVALCPLTDPDADVDPDEDAEDDVFVGIVDEVDEWDM